MQFSLTKFLKRLTVASALAVGAVVGGGVPVAGSAQAYGYNETDRGGVDLSGFKFAPGAKWYRLNDELPARVVQLVQEQTGKQLCKIEVSPGKWVSNLMPCPDKHPFMYDATIGRLRPMLNTGNKTADYIKQNYAYDMLPTEREYALAILIRDAYDQVMEERAAAAPRVVQQAAPTPQAKNDPKPNRGIVARLPQPRPAGTDKPAEKIKIVMRLPQPRPAGAPQPEIAVASDDDAPIIKSVKTIDIHLEREAGTEAPANHALTSETRPLDVAAVAPAETSNLRMADAGLRGAIDESFRTAGKPRSVQSETIVRNGQTYTRHTLSNGKTVDVAKSWHDNKGALVAFRVATNRNGHQRFVRTRFGPEDHDVRVAARAGNALRM